MGGRWISDKIIFELELNQNKFDTAIFVTGVSKGIGEALVNVLLDSTNYRVFGIGRNSNFKHENYTFLPLDLNNPDQVTEFVFPDLLEQKVVLINNAGIIGEIGPVGTLSTESFQQIQQINLIAPQILINRFLNQFETNKSQIQIINISSGAGKRPIDSWSAYCSSKAGLDLFSLTVQKEITLRDKSHIFIYALSPGVVDTKMQEEIRKVSPELFLESARFHELKDSGELLKPSFVANKILKLVENPYKYKDVLINLNEIE